ncbi:MAG: tRNA (adenosine(37)-N6)-threonylcarbamoyltransferase complex dimerization subunit type 1 TsaB [Betaproteobacteria bacterium]|nr:tRNA (adenosine(37)-N6)-threonylcarbamoyltransferase complex dimerization subunit type 1 TsaB [Betaproteobacteria bacterium]
MRFAALETSSDWCSVALSVEGRIFSLERLAPNRHSELVLPMLQSLLEEAKLAVADLEAVAFGAGPGAFTGLRIACGLAQGLALPRGLPVVPVSSFEAIAQGSGAERVVACIDARMREVYYAALERRRDSWTEVVAPSCVAPEAAPMPQGNGWIGCGSGFAAFPDILAGRLSITIPSMHPNAFSVAEIAARRIAAGEVMDAADALPVYVRDKVALTQKELYAR